MVRFQKLVDMSEGYEGLSLGKGDFVFVCDLVLLFKLFEVIFSTINEAPSRVFVSASVFTPTRDTGPVSRGARFQVPDEQRGKCQELERTPAC